MEKIKSAKVMKIIFGILALAGLAIIALYPFDNRDLSVHFVSDSGDYKIELTNYEIKNEDCTLVDFGKDTDSFLVQKVKFYGASKTMLSKEISFHEYYQ